MKYVIAFVLILAVAPISNVVHAGSCGGGEHIHSDEKKKKKKLDA